MTFTSIDGAPPEPDWTSLFTDELDIAIARDRWAIVVREMQEAGTLVLANDHAIRRLVDFSVQYERASRQVCEMGTIQKARRSKVPMPSPYWTVMRQAGEEIRVLEIELGISPVRRGKAQKVQRAKKAPRAADSYLRQVK
ncbi:P27 family predicted phage terminase small subunit [Ancylobacter sp. 3268]|uniref:P27 family phage terminase small subunit n=1 Tax=Ancylobacter sp. 3268 TaxID=2817752 RepID=UPI002859656E|nr:P27 family phage terminase small subunit [Ancylobacter sp. 3268]MDR6953798.1 P27 family predicted phage terminase small subunit [Ancylobacter sp. 3268]